MSETTKELRDLRTAVERLRANERTLRAMANQAGETLTAERAAKEAAEAEAVRLRGGIERLIPAHIADLRRMAQVFRAYEGFAATAAQCDQAADELSALLDARQSAGGA